MRIIEIEGEISAAYQRGDVICNFVSLNCVMKDALSRKIKKVYRDWSWCVEYYCRRYVSAYGNGALGRAFGANHARIGTCDPKYARIVNLFVRKKHYESCNPVYLRRALEDLKRQMIRDGETNIAILKSSCTKGRRGGEWAGVKGMIEGVFKDSCVNIYIFMREGVEPHGQRRG